MKKENFIKAIDKYHTQVVEALHRRGIAPEFRYDVVQEMFAALLKNKVYNKIDYEAIDGRILSYFKTAARGQLANMVRKQNTESEVFVSIESETDKERTEKADVRERAKDEQECPYCFLGMLNIYKACSKCGTIVGQGKTVREHMSIDEADLASLPDLDLQLDVFNALSQLEPLEQKVIKAIANGTDTLDGLADSNGMSRDTLWRTYVRAKKKLQLSLLEYSV